MSNELKHKAAIYSLFEMMFESWMDENDKQEFIELILSSSGKTLADFDADIEIGIQNGHSVEQQLEIAKSALSLNSSGSK